MSVARGPSWRSRLIAWSVPEKPAPMIATWRIMSDFVFELPGRFGESGRPFGEVGLARFHPAVERLDRARPGAGEQRREDAVDEAGKAAADHPETEAECSGGGLRIAFADAARVRENETVEHDGLLAPLCCDVNHPIVLPAMTCALRLKRGRPRHKAGTTYRVSASRRIDRLANRRRLGRAGLIDPPDVELPQLLVGREVRRDHHQVLGH